MTQIDILQNILRQRKHGAIALAGFEFQLLYSLSRFLDLLSDVHSITTIRFEGIEDVDIACRESRTYVQVKSSKKQQGWGWLNKGKILDRFAEVHRADSTANFLIVTNFEFSGDLKLFYQFRQDEDKTLPSKLSKHLNRIRDRNDLTQEEVENIISRIDF